MENLVKQKNWLNRNKWLNLEKWFNRKMVKWKNGNHGKLG